MRICSSSLTSSFAVSSSRPWCWSYLMSRQVLMMFCRPPIISTISPSWLIMRLSKLLSKSPSGACLAGTSRLLFFKRMVPRSLPPNDCFVFPDNGCYSPLVWREEVTSLLYEKKDTSTLRRSSTNTSTSLSMYCLKSSLNESFSFVNFLMYGTSISTNLMNFCLTKETSHLRPKIIASINFWLRRIAAHLVLLSST